VKREPRRPQRNLASWTAARIAVRSARRNVGRPRRGIGVWADQERECAFARSARVPPRQTEVRARTLFCAPHGLPPRRGSAPHGFRSTVFSRRAAGASTTYGEQEARCPRDDARRRTSVCAGRALTVGAATVTPPSSADCDDRAISAQAILCHECHERLGGVACTAARRWWRAGGRFISFRSAIATPAKAQQELAPSSAVTARQLRDRRQSAGRLRPLSSSRKRATRFAADPVERARDSGAARPPRWQPKYGNHGRALTSRRNRTPNPRRVARERGVRGKASSTMACSAARSALDACCQQLLLPTTHRARASRLARLAIQRGRPA